MSNSGSDIGKCDNALKPCRTILYAGSQSNKGDIIRLAGGHYPVRDTSTLFLLLSDLIPVEGLYSEETAFSEKNPANNTRPTGVPLEFADELAQKGFTVIVDSKGEDIKRSSDLYKKMRVYEQLKQPKFSDNCANGYAGDHACEKMDLLAHVPLSSFSTQPSAANDIWGFYDLNDGREYAIIGLRNGVGIVDVTEPESPRVVSSVSSQSTAWRDIKVYQKFDHSAGRWHSYAYVTADSASVGTLVIDLGSLPDSVEAVGADQSDLSAHNVYLSNVDYSTGIALNDLTPYLHVIGSDRKGGAFNSYALNDPIDLSLVYQHGSESRVTYSHDVSSMVILDDRKDSQCINSGPYCEILFDFNVDNFQIWDKTLNASPSRLSTITYAGVSYVHSGWYTEDKQVVLVHDELDEQDFNLNTTVRLFELSDLRQPTLLSTWSGPTGAIDHNGFVRGNRYYMSNYTRGMTVLDISDTLNPTEAGFFDTFPLSDETSFNGAWGVYPFLPSGNILISDINSGLYIVRDNTKKTAQGNVSFNATTYSVEEGDSLELSVERKEGSQGDVSVRWELLAGATNDDDVGMDSGILSWTDGQLQNQTISIPIRTDSNLEPRESFLIRLYDPRGSLSLGSPSISVISIQASSGNSPPVADAGGNVSVSAGETVSLQGSGSDADSTNLVYLWEQLSGQTVTLNGTDNPELTFTAPTSSGTLSFRLTVTDEMGADHSDTVTVTVAVAAVTTTPAPVERKKGGGGAVGYLILTMLLVLLTRQKKTESPSLNRTSN
ncbi:MAG TPA: choice-of-anchor B family protein [Gammaproteobacteria bacterium]|nr:choice-of-anchor B family protein [Gammaproteobacteria bacterium]HIK70834.1 choice-of-anchor B family protein [Pseudomonadales bacterium]